MNEGLRLSHGMTLRLARISPNEPMSYKDWIIPTGVSESYCCILGLREHQFQAQADPAWNFADD